MMGLHSPRPCCSTFYIELNRPPWQNHVVYNIDTSFIISVSSESLPASLETGVPMAHTSNIFNDSKCRANQKCPGIRTSYVRQRRRHTLLQTASRSGLPSYTWGAFPTCQQPLQRQWVPLRQCECTESFWALQHQNKYCQNQPTYAGWVSIRWKRQKR